MNDPIVIVSAARTAMGSFQGGFASLTAANSAPSRSRPPSSAPASTPTWSTKC